MASEASKFDERNQWCSYVKNFTLSDADKLCLPGTRSHCCELRLSLLNQSSPALDESTKLAEAAVAAIPKKHRKKLLASKGIDGCLFYPQYLTLIHSSPRNPDTIALTDMHKVGIQGPIHSVIQPDSVRPGGRLFGVRPENTGRLPHVQKKINVNLCKETYSLTVRYIFVQRSRLQESQDPGGASHVGRHLTDPSILRRCRELLSPSQCAKLRKSGIDVVVVLGGESENQNRNPGPFV